MFAMNKDVGIGLKQDNLTPVQKESLKSILNSYKTKMITIHDIYLNNQNTLAKEYKEDFYKQAYSLAYILQKYQEKDSSLNLEDYIQEAERIRDHQIYKTNKNKKKFTIMPKLTKEKYEQFIEYEKDQRFPQARKTVSQNVSARVPDSSLTKQQMNQKPIANPISGNNNITSYTNNFASQQGLNSKQGSFQSGNENVQNNSANNQQNGNGNNVGFNSARFVNQQNNNNGYGNNNNNNDNPSNQNNGQFNSSAYNRPQSNQDEGYGNKNNGYGNYRNNSYSNNYNNNNMGYARNRYQNNSRYNRGREPIEEEEPQNNAGGGGFKTAQEQKYQNQYMKKQKEEGFYNKETGRYGRNNGALELEGVDNKPKYGGYNKYNNNSGVDDVVNLVHYHTMGKNINLNNSTTQDTSVALNGGGTEDDKKATGLSRKFKPPGAPGTNPAGKKNEQNDQLKGMDQKLIDMIESEIVQNAANIKWDDIAGLQSAKRAVYETIVWPMLNPQIFTGIRAPPKGLLLFGPPGTGKTMIGKAIACESQSTFFSISASSLTSKYIGEGEKMVKILFKLALQRQPSVIFIDEIDSLLCARQENENEASRRIKTEFLVQMEGTTSKGDERILLIGATNRPQELDDAVKRRFVKKLYIPLPNREAREQLIRRVIVRESEQGNTFDMSDQDITDVVEATKGYSGADMSNLCREAALIPIRQCTDIIKIQSSDIRPINKSDFLLSIKQVKATVSKKDLTSYFQWNNDFGSFELNMEEIDT